MQIETNQDIWMHLPYFVQNMSKHVRKNSIGSNCSVVHRIAAGGVSQPSGVCVCVFVLYREPGELSGIALDYGVDDRRFESRRGLGIFLFTTASRPALGPTQPPIQWVPGALSLGAKRSGRESYQSPPSSAKVKKCVELYLRSPNTPSWRGA
jgi:hypothetical protein